MSTPTTTTAARVLADQREASESALSKVRREARKKAEFGAWQSSLEPVVQRSCPSCQGSAFQKRMPRLTLGHLHTV
jgi:hypothetical protein